MRPRLRGASKNRLLIMALLDFFKKKEARQKMAAPRSRRGAGGQPDRPSEAPVLPSTEKDAEKGDSAPASVPRVVADVLLRPHITEKTVDLSGHRTYVFRVSEHANRATVRRAVEGLYRVQVVRVNMLSMPSKRIQHLRTGGVRPGFRKAAVTVAKGHTIEFV